MIIFLCFLFLSSKIEGQNILIPLEKEVLIEWKIYDCNNCYILMDQDSFILELNLPLNIQGKIDSIKPAHSLHIVFDSLWRIGYLRIMKDSEIPFTKTHHDYGELYRLYYPKYR